MRRASAAFTFSELTALHVLQLCRRWCAHDNDRKSSDFPGARVSMQVESGAAAMHVSRAQEQEDDVGVSWCLGQLPGEDGRAQGGGCRSLP